MSVNITYFVHGTTFDNEAKKASGWLPGELSPKGISQANALKEIIKDNTFDIIFCSDLNRAIQSANILFKDEKEIAADVFPCLPFDLYSEIFLSEKFQSLSIPERRVQRFCICDNSVKVKQYD